MKTFLSICGLLGIFLFGFNYKICDIVYKEDIEKWWGLKQNIYNVILMLFQTIAFFSVSLKEKLLKSIMIFGFTLVFGNIVDRLYFNIQSVEKNDILLIIVALILSAIIWKKNLKT